MKNQSILIIVLLFIISLSCNKEEAETEPDYIQSLMGVWEFKQGPENYNYLQIGEDYLFHRLESYDAGVRNVTKGIVSVTKNQVLFNKAGEDYVDNTDFYNYTLQADSLILWDAVKTYKLLKNDSGPVATEWMVNVTPSFSMEAPVDDATDIAYDGSLIWYGNGGETDYVYSIEPNSGTTDSIPLSRNVLGIETDGSDIWVSSNGSDQIFKVQSSDGTEIGNSLEMGAWIYAMAKDGVFLWCYSNNENTIYKYNSDLNTIPVTIPVEGFTVYGLAYVDDHLYMATGDGLHKCSLNPLNTEASYTISGYSIQGVTYDGSSFWITGRNTENGEIEIMKMTDVD